MKKQRITKKVNYFKIALAIITLIEIYLLLTTKHETLEKNLNLWRLYILILFFAISNILYILYSKQFKKGVKK